VPESFSPPDNSSPLRRKLGLAILGGSFLTAGAAAVRAGRLRPRPRSPRPAESLVFWDERLLKALSDMLRRLSGRP
jgi:hypothetical protein